MGELGSLIEQQLALVGAALEGLEQLSDVAHRAYLTQDSRGVEGYAAAVSLRAFVVEGAQQIRDSQGQWIRVRACLTFFAETVDELPVVGLNDEFTLPSGLIGTVVEIPPTPVNPLTGKAVHRIAWLK